MKQNKIAKKRELKVAMVERCQKAYDSLPTNLKAGAVGHKRLTQLRLAQQALQKFDDKVGATA